MKDTNQAATTQEWTSVQAYTLAVICLLVGVAGGWLLRGSESQTTAYVRTNSTSAGFDTPTAGVQARTPAQLKQVADTQAASLLGQLKSDPNNVELLANAGNIYYDAQQYPTAIEFYRRALNSQPANVDVRTDMATAYWYSGDADSAIAEFTRALTYNPTHPNALFNLGIVKWQGKADAKGALAAWQKLLAENPDYKGKAQVQQYIEQARKHSSLTPDAGKPRPQ